MLSFEFESTYYITTLPTMGGNYPPAKYAFDLDMACMEVSLFLVGNPEWIDNFKYGFV